MSVTVYCDAMEFKHPHEHPPAKGYCAPFLRFGILFAFWNPFRVLESFWVWWRSLCWGGVAKPFT
eukprot:7573221-Alexandrium_andersonii.AAC.1